MAWNGRDRGLVAELTLSDTIFAVATMAREAWEPIWPVWRLTGGCPEGAAPSHEACVVTSFAIEAVLTYLVPECRWRVAGGRPTTRTPHGGYRDPSGVAQPHLWVVGRRRGESPWIVDLTADQFGGPPVVATQEGGHYHANATRSVLERYRLHERETVEIFLEALDAYLELQRRG